MKPFACDCRENWKRFPYQHVESCPKATTEQLIKDVLVPMAEMVREIDALTDALYYEKINDLIDKMKVIADL